MVESRPYIPRDLMGVPIPEDALLDEIRSRHGSPMHLQSESPSQSDILPSELISGSVNAFYAPERSTPTQTASSAGVSGNLNLGDLLQLSGRYSRSDTEEKLPENIKRQFGLQNPEHRHRGYEGTVRVKTSEVLDGIAPDWMTLDEVSVTYGQGRNRSTDPVGGVHTSGTRTRGAKIAGGIGPLGLAAEYMERGLYDDPNREFSARASLPLGDGQISGEFRRNINPNPRQQDETYVGGNVTIPFQEGGIVLPNPPKPDVSQAKRQAIGHQRALEAAIAEGRPPPGEEWPREKYLSISELLEPAVLPGGERDPLLDPDRPRTVDGEPVPVTDAEYMMREAGRFPNRQNPLALIGRDRTLEKTATTDMSETTGSGFSVDPGGAYEDLNPVLREVIRESDRPELVKDPGGSIVTAAEIFDEELGPQVIVEGTLDHERMHAGLDVLREADPDFELPQFPSKYAGSFSDKLNEEMWVRVIHAHTEDLSAVPTTTDLVIDGEVQFDDNGSVKLTETNKKEKYDEILLHFTEGDTDYWLSQPSAIRGINSILERAHEVGRELGSFAVTETPSDRAQFAPGGQRRYEGTEISARQPFQEGGIASLPKNPVLAGQQHMLAYITPEEAASLREQGGGVTPTGGQYTGPGGIPSFDSPGQGSAFGGSGEATGGGGGSSGVYGGGRFSVGLSGNRSFDHSVNPSSFTAQQNAIASNPPTGTTGDSTGGYPPMLSNQLAVVEAIADSKAKASLATLDDNNVPQLQDQLSRLNPKTMAYADVQSKLSKAMAAAVADGYSSGAISKANQIAHMNVPDIMGNITLALALGDQQFTAFDIAHMSDADFSALSANPATSVVGDPKSPLGMAVLGLSKPLMTMLAPPLALPMQVLSTVYGLANPDEPSLGLFGLAEQGYKGLFGETLGETLGDVSREMGLGRDPVANVTGYVSNQLGLSDAVSQIGNVFGTSTPSTPNVPGGPGLPAMQSSNQPPAGIPSVEIGLPVPPTTVTETLEDATSSYYAAQQLADATGTTLAQAEDYLASRYPQQLT